MHVSMETTAAIHFHASQSRKLGTPNTSSRCRCPCVSWIFWSYLHLRTFRSCSSHHDPAAASIMAITSGKESVPKGSQRRPSMSQHVSQNVSQNTGHPKAPGMYVSNRSQNPEVSQRRPKVVPLKIPKVWVPKASQRPFSIPSQNHRYPKHVPNRLPNSISRCYRWLWHTCHTSALYGFVCVQHEMTVRTQNLHFHAFFMISHDLAGDLCSTSVGLQACQLNT